MSFYKSQDVPCVHSGIETTVYVWCCIERCKDLYVFVSIWKVWLDMWKLVTEGWCPGVKDSLFVACIFVPLAFIPCVNLPIPKGNNKKKLQEQKVRASSKWGTSFDS